jgi:hypothetical protein
MYVPSQSHVSQASPRARDLGHKLIQQIDEYQQRNPGISPADIKNALRIAQQSTASQQTAEMRLVIVGALIALALGVFAFVVSG